jgi:hypothetical protein
MFISKKVYLSKKKYCHSQHLAQNVLRKREFMLTF